MVIRTVVFSHIQNYYCLTAKSNVVETSLCTVATKSNKLLTGFQVLTTCQHVDFFYIYIFNRLNSCTGNSFHSHICFQQEELDFCERLMVACFHRQQSDDNGMDR